MRNGWCTRRLFSAVGLCTLLTVARSAHADEHPDLGSVEKHPQHGLVNEMIARARSAQATAAKLRKSGDEARARLADSVAGEWTQAAAEVLRAVDLEAHADAARKQAHDAVAAGERERALLEEGVAQRGRLRAQLEAVTKEAADRKPVRTSAAASKARPSKQPTKAADKSPPEKTP